MDMTMNKPARPWLRKIVLPALAGGVIGFFTAMGVGELLDQGLLGQFGPSEEIAALIGMLYLVTAASVGIGVASPSFGARFLNVEDADELREQKQMLANAALGMLALGLLLIVLALAQPVGIVPAPVALAAAAVLLVLAILLSRRQMRHMDELMRRISQETASLSYYLLALVGGGWAALAHLAYVPAPAAIDWISLISAVVLVASFIAVARRGLIRFR